MPCYLSQQSCPETTTFALAGNNNNIFVPSLFLLIDSFQLFRTEKRGWGIRCLDDITKGQFICVYAGQLLTEQEANENGKQFGDEYLAELDLIESIEQAKDGYESDVDSIDEESSDTSATSNSGAPNFFRSIDLFLYLSSLSTIFQMMTRLLPQIQQIRKVKGKLSLEEIRILKIYLCRLPHPLPQRH